MPIPRAALALVLSCSLFGGLLVCAPATGASGVWTSTAPPETATVRALLPLPNGQLLLIGENEQDRTQSQRYDPATGRWSRPVMLATPALSRYIAVRLADGGVLLSGGVRTYGADRAITAAERYDLATDRWTVVPPMRTPRAEHAAVLLSDGCVLVAGGYIDDNWEHVTATAEIYDPVRNVWASAASMTTVHRGTLATRLMDGRVLVVHDTRFPAPPPDPGAEVYDPVTDRWTATTPRQHRPAYAATLLPNGQVLVFEGETAERYDATADRWISAAPLPQPVPPPVPGATSSGTDPGSRRAFSVTTLLDGQLLVTGGYVQGYSQTPPAPTRMVLTSLTATDRYDPVADRWTAEAPLTTARVGHLSALLPDGRVLTVGGTEDVGSTRERSVEIYAPPQTCFAETDKCLRGRFLNYWEGHGGLAINGFPLSDEFEQVLENGRTYRVQYFERVRMEYHPENAGTVHEVLLGQFGRHILRARTGHDIDPPVLPAPEARYFPQTGHNVANSFRRFWETNGGESAFGFPLGEERQEILEDGREYTVQYFERARFEYHPGDTPSDVVLGQFGRAMLAETAGTP